MDTRALITGAMVLVGCGNVELPVCETSRGLRYAGPEVADCLAFQYTEDKLLETLKDVTFDGDERRLRGVTVRLHPLADPETGSWSSPIHGGMQIAGYAACWDAAIYVGHVDFPNQILAHELIHILDNCHLGPDGDSHYRWPEDGIYTAIWKAGRGLEGETQVLEEGP